MAESSSIWKVCSEASLIQQVYMWTITNPNIVPINLDQSKLMHLANTFGCQAGSLPFTYLGLPLGATRPTMNEFSPLINRIERRLSGINKFLSYSGRHPCQLSLYSTPTFYMCTLKLPPQVVKQTDSFRKKCLWNKGNVDRRGRSLVAWDQVTKPKEEGGLGIINIQ